MNVHLVDGTYELFRHYYALPSRLDSKREEVGGLVGVLQSVASMFKEGVTHIGVATDHVVESFRNDLYPGYKTGEGIEPSLWRQFHPLEDALRAFGVTVWAMTDQEADDGLAAAAHRAASDSRVERVFICTPDKDLSQCVVGERVVQYDRRKRALRNEAGVHEKFGVGPQTIPDWLALVGDSSDGFPGVPGWGEKSASTVLARYQHLEAIPHEVATWDVTVRGAAKLSASLREHWDDALLFRKLATLRTDYEAFNNIDELQWRGPTSEFPALCQQLGIPEMAEEWQ